MKILIFLPARNEESNILMVLKTLQNVRIRYGLDVLVFDDASTDKTAAVIREAGFEVFSCEHHIGYCKTLVRAYEYALLHNYDYIIQMDADGQHDPLSVGNLLHCLERNPQAHIVLGSRFLAESKAHQTSHLKWLGIKFFSLWIRAVTGLNVSDPSTGFQLISAEVLKYYVSPGMFPHEYPDSPLILHMAKNKFNIVECGVVMYPRIFGKGMHEGCYRSLRYMVVVSYNMLRVQLSPQQKLASLLHRGKL